MYPPQRRNKRERLLPDEIAVQEALREYRFEGRNEDFVPARILYAGYLRWVNRGHYADSPRYLAALKAKSLEIFRIKPLSIAQFGAALRRVYPDLMDNPHWRVRRTLGRHKPETGFSHLIGPHSRKTKERHGFHKTPTPTTAFQRCKEYPEDSLDAEIMG